MVATPPRSLERPSTAIVMRGVSWPTYQALMAEVGGDRAWRIAYDRGVLELRMPLEEHEEPKGLLESLIEAIADELEIEVRKLGSLTLEREDLARAVEPDSCFYIQNEAVVRGRNINLPSDPPPDLVIESDYTNSSVNKLPIYAALGVPELWRYTNQSLLVYSRVENSYNLAETSLAFPFLPIAEVGYVIEQSRTLGQRSAVRLFRHRIRDILTSQSQS
ncbi:Uma2 family endonuclease [Nodosilinea sp. LEGE 07088]|uniref:Uma2 family endonuclease n=1 Tax=Nodosilinea sp. LEGE 07088 TaxID=2777968 RepID=UPI001880547A|nr:Uma2 family endonuclease [Nodosilinea sp. LEGE 07088]MBE9137760.1 Uma2 family endonuclease [Nodosilinea sp. LEGE 07088]